MPVRPDSKSCVCLHADEFFITSQLEVPIVDLRFELQPALSRLGAILVLKVGNREADANRRVRLRADGHPTSAVRLQQVFSRARGAGDVSLVPGWVDPEHVSGQPEPLRLVDRA